MSVDRRKETFIKENENKIICEINGVEFYVQLRSGVAS